MHRKQIHSFGTSAKPSLLLEVLVQLGLESRCGNALPGLCGPVHGRSDHATHPQRFVNVPEGIPNVGGVRFLLAALGGGSSRARASGKAPAPGGLLVRRRRLIVWQTSSTTTTTATTTGTTRTSHRRVRRRCLREGSSSSSSRFSSDGTMVAAVAAASETAAPAPVGVVQRVRVGVLRGRCIQDKAEARDRLVVVQKRSPRLHHLQVPGSLRRREASGEFPQTKEHSKHQLALLRELRGVLVLAVVLALVVLAALVAAVREGLATSSVALGKEGLALAIEDVKGMDRHCWLLCGYVVVDWLIDWLID
mmetsp:Transcript_15549/g.43089  ORF Transcript_15549/g.43089 Transcript_15549/m.43089 type:complete len:307 (+) Transcript_15549:223-1143(+)